MIRKALAGAAILTAACSPGHDVPVAPVAQPVTPTTLELPTLDVAVYADVVPVPVVAPTTTTTEAPEPEPVTTVPTTVARRAPVTTVDPNDMPSPQSRTTRGSAPPDYIKQCESGGDYAAVNPNGHYGAWQFSLSTWSAVGGSGNPADASPAEQDMRAGILWDGGNGAGQWACS